MIKPLYLLISLFLCFSCNEVEKDEAEEDYDRLFPLKKEIEKHTPMPGEAIVKQGDVNVNRKSFKYEGNDTIQDKNTYTITLKYRLKEDYSDMEKSRYFVRFVNEDKTLTSIYSDPKTKFMPHDEFDETADVEMAHPEMESNREYTIRFKAKSGFQLFLCVNGAGPRNSGIRAKITAVADDDGLTPPLVLQTEQYQTQEGQAMLSQPYCKYVILP